MILITGASGRLGGLVARQLLANGVAVRALSRMSASLVDLQRLGAETITGDLRDPASLNTACQGIDTVLAATHAFNGSGANSSRAVDAIGARSLIDAAQAAGARHFVFTSAQGADPHSSVDMFRYKYDTEQYLRASGMSYTILRPAAYMETWAHALGDPILKSGRAMVFGRGDNPINFVSAGDVARFAVFALTDADAWGRVIEIGGPENITETDFVRKIQEITGRQGKIQHIPRPMMRLLGVIAQPFNPVFSRQSRAGVLMDTQDMTCDSTEALKLLPMRLTRLSEVIRSEFGSPATITS
jgi:NADH dehydrogenase